MVTAGDGDGKPGGERTSVDERDGDATATASVASKVAMRVFTLSISVVVLHSNPG